MNLSKFVLSSVLLACSALVSVPAQALGQPKTYSTRVGFFDSSSNLNLHCASHTCTNIISYIDPTNGLVSYVVTYSATAYLPSQLISKNVSTPLQIKTLCNEQRTDNVIITCLIASKTDKNVYLVWYDERLGTQPDPGDDPFGGTN